MLEMKSRHSIHEFWPQFYFTITILMLVCEQWNLVIHHHFIAASICILSAYSHYRYLNAQPSYMTMGYKVPFMAIHSYLWCPLCISYLIYPSNVVKTHLCQEIHPSQAQPQKGGGAKKSCMRRWNHPHPPQDIYVFNLTPPFVPHSSMFFPK